MSEACSCISVDVENQPEMHERKIIKARADWTCDECGDPIPKGTQYEYVHGKWDGKFGTYKTCLGCLSIRDQFFCDSWEYTMMWERVHEHIQDTDGKISSDCILALNPEGREKLLDAIQDYWDESDGEE